MSIWQIIGVTLFIGIPVLVLIVIPMAFLNNLDKHNPPHPDMW